MITQSLLFSSLIFIVPTVIGAFVYVLTYFRENDQKLKIDLPHTATAVGHAFVYGALIMFFQAAFLTKYVNNNFELWFMLLVAVEIILGFLGTAFALWKKRRKIDTEPKDLLIFSTLVALSLIAYGIWRWNSPITATLDWDMFMHQSAIDLIRQGKFSYDTLEISDTFKFYSYTPMFHVIVLGAQIFLKNIDVPSFWCFAQYWHFLLTIVASYTLAYAVTKKKTIGFVSALLGAFIFESFIAYTSLFLIPQTLTALNLVLFIAGEILRYSETRKIIELSTIATVSYLVLNHMVVGFAGIFIILFSIVYLRLFKNKGKVTWHRVLLLLMVAAIPVMYLVSKYIDLGFLNRGEAAFFTLNLSDKYHYMRQFYGYFLVAFLPAGLVHVFRKRPNTNEVLNALIALAVLGVVISELPYVLKFYTIGRYFVHVVIAIGIWELMEGLHKYIQGILISLVAASLIVIFTINTGNFKHGITYSGIASHLSSAEYQAALFMKKNYSRNNTIIVSDPTTMHIMEGVSGINTPGGAFTDTRTRKLLSKIYFSRDSLEMKKTILTIKDGIETNTPTRMLFVMSGRFSKWQLSSEDQKMGIVWNIWRPSGLAEADIEYIDFIDRNLDFKKVYNTSEIVVYEIE
uniref:Glycosyltransferase RgtA/B/C/D-like domain-containing protein n=1 Tax=candidate division WWE3 bacterium TaxID=2053526 RepID=A0A7C4TQG3_UNCKA